MNGTFPATITAVKTVDTRTDILIELEYIGLQLLQLLEKISPQANLYFFI
jgi:hypothetical protein